MPIVVPSSGAQSNGQLLALVQLAMQGLGVVAYGQPSSVVGNSNQDVMQVLALVNQYGDELARSYDWQALSKEYRFSTSFYQYTGNNTSGAATVTGMSSTANLDSTFLVTGGGVPQDTYVQSVDSASQITLTSNTTAGSTGATFTFGKAKYALPSDWDRQTDRSHWDRSKRWELLGPETSQQWQWLKSSYISTGPRLRYRLLGNYFQIWPLIAANENLGFEYLSKNWIYDTGATATNKKNFTADSDVCIFPDQVMIAMIRLAYYTAKGFDTTSFAQSYAEQVDLAKAHDAGSQTLSMSPRQSDVLISMDQVPDTGYGS